MFQETMKVVIKTIKDAEQETKKCIDIILTSNRKDMVVKAFNLLICIVSGKCICDTCKEWDKDIYLVYEFSRCLVPSRVFQMIKERYVESPKWNYVKPLYTSLFNTVYEDLLPDKEILSNGDMENQICTAHILTKELVDKAQTIREQEKKDRICKSTKLVPKPIFCKK